MSWKEEYKSKLMSVEDVAKKVNSGDKIMSSAGCTAPVDIIEAICDRVDELENVGIISGLFIYPFKFFQSPKFLGRIDYTTFFYGPYARAYKSIGNTNINSVHLSNSHKAIIDFNANIFISDVSTPDENGYMYFGTMGGCLNWSGLKNATLKMLQVNKYQPKIKGVEHRIHISEVDFICEANREVPELPDAKITEIDEIIAKFIIPQIEDGSTLQLGIGALANAIGYNLGDKKNLSMHTEMLTDSLVHLIKEGVINGKQLTAFGLGKKSLYEFVENSDIQFAPFIQVNDVREIAKNDKMVSINSTLMVDLTAQVSSESIGHTQYSSTGGQLDFVRGAGLSKGGKSFLCLSSTLTDKEGNVKSKIVSSFPVGQIVTTPRTDAMYIVTEYGIADVYCKSIPDRVEALIAIAHPDFREALRADAIKNGIIKA